MPSSIGLTSGRSYFLQDGGSHIIGRFRTSADGVVESSKGKSMVSNLITVNLYLIADTGLALTIPWVG